MNDIHVKTAEARVILDEIDILANDMDPPPPPPDDPLPPPPPPPDDDDSRMLVTLASPSAVVPMESIPRHSRVTGVAALLRDDIATNYNQDVQFFDFMFGGLDSFYAWQRLTGEVIVVRDGTLRAQEYALFSHALRQSSFTRVMFDQIATTRNAESLLRGYDWLDVTLAHCVFRHGLNRHPTKGYLKACIRLYRAFDVVFIEPDIVGGQIRIGEDNSPGSAGQCGVVTIADGSFEHLPLYVNGDPGVPIQLSDTGQMTRLVLDDGFTINSPNTRWAVEATAPTVVEIGDATFNDAPMHTGHIKWRAR